MTNKILTWEDVKQIVKIADYLVTENTPDNDMPDYLSTEQKYYEKILEIFNTLKNFNYKIC